MLKDIDTFLMNNFRIGDTSLHILKENTPLLAEPCQFEVCFRAAVASLDSSLEPLRKQLKPQDTVSMGVIDPPWGDDMHDRKPSRYIVT